MGGGRAEWMKRIATAAPPRMPFEQLRRWGDELKKGVWGYWEDGRWKHIALSALRRAKLKRQVLLAGGEWPYDKPRRPMRDVMKGHKKDKIAAEKRKATAEIMLKMPQMIADCRKRARERRQAAAKNRQ